MSDKSLLTTQEFFRSWQLYQDVIEHNYMAHREIIASLREFSETKDLNGAAVLDLGCGDAYTARSAWGDAFHHVRFTGVDLSGPALRFAQEALAETDWKVDLIEVDLNRALEELQQPFDLILAGHALHHLREPAKQRALVRMRALLSPQGNVLIYDLLPRANEPRDAYVQRLLRDNERDWKLLTREQLLSIRGHVENFDFPIELTTWKEYAADAGFASCELIYRDVKDHYGLLHLSP